MDRVEKTVQKLTEGYSDIPSRMIQLDESKSKYDQAIYKLAKEIMISEDLRRAINKTIGKEPIEQTLLKALECISLMTGDKLFYTENSKKIEKSL